LCRNNQSFGQRIHTNFHTCHKPETTFYTHITTLVILNTHLGYEFWQNS
jgi:hypothetical protein